MSGATRSFRVNYATTSRDPERHWTLPQQQLGGPGTEPWASPGLLAGFREKLDRALAGWLDAKREEAVALGSPETLELIDGVGQLATQGGKRLRPALVYYTYRACGGASDDEALPLALATELLHTYLLIHDDIMDHAEVRRGQPSAHVRFRDAHRAHGLHGDAEDFGRSVAILLGDLAQSWAVELAAGSRRPSARGGELARCFSAMCQEVIGGQYLELLVAQRPGGDGGGAAAGAAPEVRPLHGRAADPARRPAGRRAAGAARRALALRRRGGRSLPAPGRPPGDVRRRRHRGQAGGRRPAGGEVHLPDPSRPGRGHPGAAPGTRGRPRQPGGHAGPRRRRGGCWRRPARASAVTGDDRRTPADARPLWTSSSARDLRRTRAGSSSRVSSTISWEREH